jgi:hypothetical protein
VEVRAAHHPGLNRVVLQFDGGLPELSALHRATSPPTLEPSGLPSHVHGNAFVTAVFQGATGNRTTPPYGTTYGASRRAWDLPNASHLVVVGDSEGSSRSPSA